MRYKGNPEDPEEPYVPAGYPEELNGGLARVTDGKYVKTSTGYGWGRFFRQ
jgi:hypothetical protein